MQDIEIDLSNREPLGQGSFCDVHLVEMVDERRIAVRTLIRRWITRFDRKFDLLPDFQEECQTLLQLDHPNIIRTFGGSEKVRKAGLLQFGILTEWCERGTLRRLIFDAKFLYSMKNVAIWSENLFDALDYMFKTRRIIHRDIKPENILVTKDFIVKLGDFGETKKIEQTCSGTFDVGTWRYRSPPQLDPNQTNGEFFDQGRTNSSRNDVYALGLVIWQLIERRLVFAKYGTQGEFDYSRFTVDVILGNLKRLDPPECPSDFQKIVEDCCNFDRSKRPNIEETLKRLQEFKEVENFNDSNDDYPTINKNQQELIRPIGFDQLENREHIPVTSPFDISENKGHKLIGKYDPSWTINLRKEFIKRFDEMSNHEKMNFNKQIQNIIVDAINKNYKYFHEYSLDLKNLEKNFDQMDIRQIFEKIVLARQNLVMFQFQRLLRRHNKNSMKMSGSPWLLLIEMKEVAALYNAVKDIPFPNLKFKCFRSSQTYEEWILIDTPSNTRDRPSYDFLSKSLNKYLSLEAEQPTENKSVFYSEDDELNYLDDFIMKTTEFVQLLEREKLKIQTRINQNFCLSRIQRSEITQEIIKNLPIEEYLFQLNNPPRIQCSHKPKCDITMQVLSNEDIKIPYCSCSSERQNNYLSLWIQFVSGLDWFWVYLGLNVDPIQEPPNSDPIVLLQVIYSRSIEYITLLDFSDQYFNDPRAPYLDSELKMRFMDGRILQKSLNETPENKRKYLVVTRIARNHWNVSFSDYQGKESYFFSFIFGYFVSSLKSIAASFLVSFRLV